MNITIARLRSNVKYNGPLETVLDSFFENYVKWMKANPQHEYKTYNVSFGKEKLNNKIKKLIKIIFILFPLQLFLNYHY